MSTGSKRRLSVIGFYGHGAGKKYGEFSNFFLQDPYLFTLPAFAQRKGFPLTVWCSFSEKAIMATKAALMGDLEVFHAIDASNDPKSVKALGRRVRNWNEALWQEHLEEIAFEVVRQKFEASKKLRTILFSTGKSIIAEAAPSDRTWGIGLPLTDTRVMNPEQWCGRNVLGFALMRAREHLQAGRSAPQTAQAGTISSSSAAVPAEAAQDTVVAAADPAPVLDADAKELATSHGKLETTSLVVEAPAPEESKTAGRMDAAPTLAEAAAMGKSSKAKRRWKKSS